MIDKVIGEKPKDKSHPYFFDDYTVFCRDEVYYLINSSNFSSKLIAECLRRSTSFWHSLGLITTADLREVEKEFSSENIREICLKTEVAFVGAYDGEGYVFWEKNPSNGSKSFFECDNVAM